MRIRPRSVKRRRRQRRELREAKRRHSILVLRPASLARHIASYNGITGLHGFDAGLRRSRRGRDRRAPGRRPRTRCPLAKSISLTALGGAPSSSQASCRFPGKSLPSKVEPDERRPNFACVPSSSPPILADSAYRSRG